MTTITEMRLPGVLLVEPDVFGDPRGYFLETFRKNAFARAGITVEFVQDNLSFSQQGTLRGLHYQHPNDQGKLVQVLLGEIVDVALDIRVGSPTFSQWLAVTLSADNHRSLFIPPGFAHGFCVISKTALFSYKCSDYYAPEHEGGVLWNDPALGIPWSVEQPLLSEKDKRWPELKDIDLQKLPGY